MLYAVLGALLEKAAAALRSEQVSAGGEHADVQRRRVAAFVGRVGRTWPGHLDALLAQNEVLAGAASDLGGTPQGGPVAEHVRLLAQLDLAVQALHASGDHAGRRELRRRLAEAARIEMELVAAR